MGRLHDRMAEDFRLRNFSPTTQRNYLLYARRFAAFFMHSPEELGETEIGQFLLHRIGGKVKLPGTVRPRIEKEEAARAAWSAPGVYSVENLITVEPW